MAKRARGGVRPGQRRAAARPQPRPNVLSRDAAAAAPTAQPATAAATRPGGLTAEEEARAAEIEAQIVEQERSVETTRRRRGARERDLASIDAERTRGVQAGGLEAQASQEYAYVVRDVRRIVAIGGLLLVVLAILFVLIEGAHVVRI